jgi:hypothetical protein
MFRWKDNIEMDFRELECEGADSIHLPQVMVCV